MTAVRPSGGVVEPMDFASPEWLDVFLKLLFAKTALDLDGTVGVTCEVYTDVPGHIPSQGGRVAWTRIVSGGAVDLFLGECPDEDADVKTVGDYEAFRTLVKMPLSQQTLPEFAAMVDRLVKEGRIVSVRDKRTSHPPADLVFHNYVAMLTA